MDALSMTNIKRATWENSIEYYPKKPKTYTRAIVIATLITAGIWLAYTLTQILNLMIIYAEV